MHNLTKLFFILVFSTIHIQHNLADGMLDEDLMISEDETIVENHKPSLGEKNNKDTQVVFDRINSTTFKDPFKRGVTRSPAYATFNDDANDMQYRPDDLRHLTDLHFYRLASIIQRDEVPRTKILKLFEQDFYGDEHEAYYVRIKSATSPKDLMVVAKTLEVSYYKSLNRNIIIRNITEKNNSSYAIEYGPFPTIKMAVANCYYVATFVKNNELDCNQSIHKHFVSESENNKNKSFATVGLSQFGLLALKEKPFGFDLNVLSRITIEIMEGETLGPYGFYVTNINEMGVSVAGLNGDVFLIPVSTFPINISSKSSPAGVSKKIITSPSN